MLTVAGSGLIGRYIYARIHFGLYGRKADLGELRDSADGLRAPPGSDTSSSKIGFARKTNCPATRSAIVAPSQIRKPVMTIRFMSAPSERAAAIAWCARDRR